MVSKETLGPLRRQPNWDVVNAVRGYMSNEFQTRIPEATKANIRESVETLWKFEPLRNEFAEALVNRIGAEVFRDITWNNAKFGRFKKGLLEFGDTVEEAMVGLVQDKGYDPRRDSLEGELFGQELPEIDAIFHRINSQRKYKITIKEPILRRAFLNDYGLSTLIGQLMAAPTTSANWDEFLLMTNLFAEAHRMNAFYKVNVPDLTAMPTAGNEAMVAVNARLLLRQIRTYTELLQYPSRKYNAARMYAHAQGKQLHLFMTPEVKAAIDVEALAAAFNVPFAEVDAMITTIPREYFHIPGVQALLTTEDFFQVWDTYNNTNTIDNPAALHQNFWHHVHQIISFSTFVPAVLFWTGVGDAEVNLDSPVTGITAITVQNREGTLIPTTGTGVANVVQRGDLYHVNADAVTTPPDGPNNGVKLTLKGAENPATTLDNTGTLYVPIGESAAKLTITAQALDGDFTATRELTLEGGTFSKWPRTTATKPK